MTAKELRAMLAKLTPEEFRKISSERMKEHQLETNRFCGKCGGVMHHHAKAEGIAL